MSANGRFWGDANATLRRPSGWGGVDLLLAACIAGVLFGIVRLSREWTGELRPAVEIDLSLTALPRYTLFSLSRGLLAYLLSLGFTLVYGFWAAKDKLAERLLIPLLDILQSIPVLGFMPGLVLALVAAFPRSNVGLELAAILMIFTGQAWNMAFSLYHSLGSIPQDQRDAATAYRFTFWQRVRWLELPFSAIGLVWNSMMSMAGGWFFLMVNEAFVLGDKDFRLPGLGSYMSVAVAKGDDRAMIAAVAAMAGMIVLLDQVLWHPVVVWARKFRVEEGGEGEAPRSWVIDLLRRSRVIAWWLRKRGRREAVPGTRARRPVVRAMPRLRRLASRLSFGALAVVLAFGGYHLVHLLRVVSFSEWATLGSAAMLTLGRVLASTLVGTLWALPAGLAIGLSAKLSRILQPIIQVVASFPAPMLFPVVITVLRSAGVSLGWGSIVLMLLGTQWYILFNVVAGASAVPWDLREAARSYRFGIWQRFRSLYFPAVFPHLVTGWVTAAGGAWNASIVSEYVTLKGEALSTRGLGALISESAARAEFPALAAAVLVMSIIVVAFNRAVWKRLHLVAERRFSLSK